MARIHLLPVIVIAFALVASRSIVLGASATSPIFVRNEWTTFTGWVDFHNPSHFTNVSEPSTLSSVTYSSNGAVLDTTLWLTSPFKQRSGHTISYGLLIDADSNNKTGWEGADYMTKVVENNNIWHTTMAEMAATGQMKILSDSNATSEELFRNSFSTVHLRVNMSALNFPSQYMIRFFIEDTFKRAANVLDIAYYSTWIPVPFSEYSLDPIPNSVTLRPGETHDVDVQVISHTAQENTLILKIGKLDGINATFGPIGNTLFVPPTVAPYSSQRVLLNVGAEVNANPSTYLLPISADIYDPSSSAATPLPSEHNTSNYYLVYFLSNFRLKAMISRPKVRAPPTILVI